MPKYPLDIFRKNRRNSRRGPADTRSWRRNRRHRMGTVLMRKNVKKISHMPLERSGEHPALRLAPLPKAKEAKPAQKPDSQIKSGFYILPR